MAVVSKIKTHERLKRTPIVIREHNSCAYFQDNRLLKRQCLPYILLHFDFGLDFPHSVTSAKEQLIPVLCNFVYIGTRMKQAETIARKSMLILQMHMEPTVFHTLFADGLRGSKLEKSAFNVVTVRVVQFWH